MYRLTLLLLLLICSSQFVLAGGPWTPWKNKGIFIFSTTPIVYSGYSSTAGRSQISLNRRVTELHFQAYVEYGITDELTVVGNLPFRLVRTSSSTQDGDFIRTLPASSQFGVGNTELEFKYKFFQKKFLITAGLRTAFPTGPYDRSKGLRLGYDAFTIYPIVYMGGSFSSRAYLQGDAGYAYRTNDYSGEIRINLEGGYKVKDKVWLALLIIWRESLENGSRNDLITNNAQTGLYLNDQEYIAWTIKMAVPIKSGRWGVNASIGGGAITALVARTPSISAGFYYDWQQPKKS